MSELQVAVQNHDISVVAELAAKYSLLAIVIAGIAASLIGLV